MDAEFGPKDSSTHPTPDEPMPDEPETRQLVPIIAQHSAIHQSVIDPNDLGPILMTEAELEEGIVTPRFRTILQVKPDPIRLISVNSWFSRL